MYYTENIKEYIEYFDAKIFNVPAPVYLLSAYPEPMGVAGFCYQERERIIEEFELWYARRKSLNSSIQELKKYERKMQKQKTPHPFSYTRAMETISETADLLWFLEHEYESFRAHVLEKKPFYVVATTHKIVASVYQTAIAKLEDYLKVYQPFASKVFALNVAVHEVRHRVQRQQAPGFEVRIIKPREKYAFNVYTKTLALRTYDEIEEHVRDDADLYERRDFFLEYDAAFFGNLVIEFAKKYKELPPLDELADILKKQKSVASFR